MSLVIQHNLMAQTAARNLSASYGSLSDSIRKLSSGLRIEQAADDPAGLAVRELMRSEIATLSQGMRNANDAISLIQTADGALSVIDEKLIRMKELAMQAATGTYTSDQRLIIDSEYQAMASEIDRIANATDFNGLYLLNGNLSSDVHNGAGLTATGKLKVHFGTGNDSAEDYYYLQIGSATTSALGLLSGGTAATPAGGIIGQTEAQYVSANSLVQVGGSTTWSDMPDIGTGFYTNTPGGVSGNIDAGATVNVYRNAADTRRYLLVENQDQELISIRYDFLAPNVYDYASVATVNSPNPGSAGTAGSISISTQQLAQGALETIQRAIVSKDNIRANLGAMQNRLENTISNLDIQRENLQAAESRISDVDVSQEMTTFVRGQILTQAASAMLAQANNLPRMALQLLG